MGTQVTHEPPPNSPNPPVEDLELKPTIPPTDQPPVQPIDNTKYIGILEETLRDQNRKIQELNTKLNTTPPAPAVPSKTPDEERAEFFRSPVESNRKMIREEVTATIAPLVEFVSRLNTQDQMAQMINRYKFDPRFSGMWDNDVEAFVRQNTGAIPADKLTDDVFGTVVVSAIGMKATGLLTKSTSAPSPSAPPATPPAPPTAPVMPTPPHMRPSAPPGPSGGPNNKPGPRALTEHEERLRRERNMTVEQYLSWLEVPASDVVSSDIGKPPKA